MRMNNDNSNSKMVLSCIISKFIEENRKVKSIVLIQYLNINKSVNI